MGNDKEIGDVSIAEGTDKVDFGMTSSGEQTSLYKIKNKNGIKVAVTDYGATVVSIVINDRNGMPTDVVLGYDDVSGYEAGDSFFGACIGRNANRIGNAECTIAGISYKLVDNDGGNTLHGGHHFYSNRVWKAESIKEDCITFTLHSEAFDQELPGNLDIQVTYSISESNEFTIRYQVVGDADTLVNMTNHSYFNLDGHDSGNVLKEKVWIDADFFTGTDEKSIPTGELVPVNNTPMDFREMKELGQEIEADYEALHKGRGYDHNYVLKNHGQLSKVAEAVAYKSGIQMEVYTDLPGLQLYTANYLVHVNGKSGAVYGTRSAVCFETQYFPDAPHHSNFPDSVLKKGEVYNKTTTYRFSVS